MFNHRQKTIGKSLYKILPGGAAFKIIEIDRSTNQIVGSSSRGWTRIDDALNELARINREHYYSDGSRRFCMDI